MGGAGASTSTMAASSTVATTVTSSSAQSTAAASSASGGGKTCKVAADCGSGSCGWSCAAGMCALTPAAKFSACYKDGGTGASCDGAGNCNTWIAITTVGAPSARYNHSAIWTGTKMIVWGGFTKVGLTDTGYAYTPLTDTWAPISTVNAPLARHDHEAVWIGTKMYIWGGYGTGNALAPTGGIYDLATDSWTAMATTAQPLPRQAHAMVYTGTKILVWGGRNAAGAVNTGGVYTVATNTWGAMATAGQPSARSNFSYGWQPPTNLKPNGYLYVWGGTDSFDWFSNGAFYDPGTNAWTVVDMSVGAPPNGGSPPTGVLESLSAFPQSPTQGLGFYLFGGWNGGDVYGDTLFFWDLAANALDGYWYKLKPADPAAPSPRARYFGVTLNAGIFLWGGCNDAGCETVLGDGGVWRPGANGGTWSSFPEDAALTKRSDNVGVWTGKAVSEVILWGGYVNGPVGTGARRAVDPG